MIGVDVDEADADAADGRLANALAPEEGGGNAPLPLLFFLLLLLPLGNLDHVVEELAHPAYLLKLGIGCSTAVRARAYHQAGSGFDSMLRQFVKSQLVKNPTPLETLFILLAR